MAPLILIVDDSEDIRHIVSLMLKHKGYETITADGGSAAVRVLEKRRPDLILCDILMPGMDGFQVFQYVRGDRRWRHIPFVFLTALADSHTRLSSSELGAEAYLTKPFDKEELLAVIAGLLRRAQELATYTVSEMESFKAQLLFMITHELNTPLSVIRMLTESMRSSLGKLNKIQIAEYLDLLAHSTDDLSYIVESMLLALQIDSGRAQQLFDTWAAPHGLRTILEIVINRSAAQRAERGVSLEAVGLDKPLCVEGHEAQLLQIFGRVLDNAVNFSPKGGLVTVRLARHDGQALVTITDQGPGMTPAEIKAAFQRLSQINRAQQEQQGVGLSLNLVRSLVTIHGGQISVASTPGQGASFTIALPIVEAPR